jgi:hypothetical protein
LWRNAHVEIFSELGIVTEYPTGFIFFCLLLGAAYAFILYFRTGDHIVIAWQRWLMSVLRFAAVSVISFLLLSPLVKRTTETIDKPLIIFAQDNSLSIVLTRDSSYYKFRYPEELNGLVSDLKKKYEVSVLSFGDRVTQGPMTNFSEKSTDISSLIDEVNTRYSNRNIGALILASDGIYNRGRNPVYATQKLRFPIYTVMLGDSSIHRDIVLKKITCNHSVFLGDKFPVEIDVSADKCNGELSELKVKKGDQVLFTRELQFSGESDFKKVFLTLDATQKGIHRFSVQIKPVDKETTVINNNRDFFVDVFDSKEKILILYQSPHPDIAAIRHALEGNPRFEVTDTRMDELSKQVETFDLVILDQLPSDNTDLRKIAESRTPALFIVGTQTKLDAFNNLRTGLAITSDRTTFTEALPALNEGFSLFTVSSDIRDVLKNVPPLTSPFGSYQHSPMADVLVYQKMGNIQSKMPLIMFIQNAGKKTGFITGENIWKWRLSDYMQTGNHEAFDELINKIVQYLSVKGDRDFFRIKCENTYQENENVEMEAEVYNQSYELVNQEDVNLTITDEKNKKYPYVFGKTEKNYYLNAGSFPAGNYKYEASVKLGSNVYQKKGEFFVAPLNLEELTTTADFNLLYRIAKEHDGELVFPKEMKDLANKISKREDIRPVSYFQKRYSDITGNLWIFILVIGMLTVEWLMRKRSGVY